MFERIYATYGIQVRWIFIAFYSSLILVQIPWIAYFIVKAMQAKKNSTELRRNIDQSDTIKKLTRKHINNLQLYKHFLVMTIFEFLTYVTLIINYAFTIGEPTFNCSQYYYPLYLHLKYNLQFASVLFFQCTLAVLNLTTLFVKNVYLGRNAESEKQRKKTIFVIKLLPGLFLALSGVGILLGITSSLVFIIIEFIYYYKHSKQLYRVLTIIREDVKYEYGEGSFKEVSARKQRLHYKRFAIWFYVVASMLVIGIFLFLIILPQLILGEQCIVQVFSRHNLTFFNNTMYKDSEIGLQITSSVFYAAFALTFIPVYTIYSLYYLVDKFLYVRVFQPRYHVRYSVGVQDLEYMLV